MYQLNVCLLVNVIICLLQSVLMAVLNTRNWLLENKDTHYYIFPESKIDIDWTVLKTMVSFYLQYNMLIPLDIMIQILIVKMLYA